MSAVIQGKVSSQYLDNALSLKLDKVEGHKLLANPSIHTLERQLIDLRDDITSMKIRLDSNSSRTNQPRDDLRSDVDVMRHDLSDLRQQLVNMPTDDMIRKQLAGKVNDWFNVL